MSDYLLEVKNLSMHYDTLDGNVDAVKDISFAVKSGESFGLVGESGCGKTSVAMTLLQLQPDNSVITEGSIKLDGEELINNIILDTDVDKTTTLIIILTMMFFLGFILDFIEIIFIVIPLFGPALFELGFDPVWIGILIAMVLQTSFLTPPFGFSIFYLRGVANDQIKTVDIYKGVVPFVVIQLVVILLIFIFPEIATILPKIIFN